MISEDVDEYYIVYKWQGAFVNPHKLSFTS